MTFDWTLQSTIPVPNWLLLTLTVFAALGSWMIMAAIFGFMKWIWPNKVTIWLTENVANFTYSRKKKTKLDIELR